MTKQQLLDLIGRGRTDLVFDLLSLPDWRGAMRDGSTKAMQWFVYYNDVTVLKAVLQAGGDLSSLVVNEDLGHAAFFGHWQMCDFLIKHGADVNHAVRDTGETPLHGALAKAGRPYYIFVLRLLLAHGANVNARTIAGRESGAFMRDVRTRAETPLHRAAAYGDDAMIELLLQRGADREALDANGDSPLTWASRHLRPRSILWLLAYGRHTVSAAARTPVTSDQGVGWGNGMDWTSATICPTASTLVGDELATAVALQVQHGGEVAMVDAGRCRCPHLRLGVVGHAEAHRLEHGDVVGAIAEAKRLLVRQAELGPQFEQAVQLGLGAGDCAGDIAGERSVPRFELVADKRIEAGCARHARRKERKSSRHQGGVGAVGTHGAH